MKQVSMHLKRIALAAAVLVLPLASVARAEMDSVIAAMKICSANLGNDMALEKAFRKNGWDRQPYNSPELIVFTKDAERSIVAFPRAYRNRSVCMFAGGGGTPRQLVNLVAQFAETSAGKFRPVPKEPGLWARRVGEKQQFIGVDPDPKRLYFFTAPVILMFEE